jgi:MPBQ/MSBQ methyltransferase
MPVLTIVPWLLAAILLLVLGLALRLWQRRDRHFVSSATVAEAYDRWTADRLLERLWGDHVHLGYYPTGPLPNPGQSNGARKRTGLPARGRAAAAVDFRQAKVEFVHALVRWSGLDQLPPGSKVLDVGCGIGGSARILARDYGLDVLGISISPGQIQRARELTDPALSCQFAVMDALDLDLADASFAAVWSVEAGPHMPDKQRFADELLRVLAPGGRLALADWNRRDPADGPLDRRERWVMRQLLDQWAHPEFASIAGFARNLRQSPFAKPAAGGQALAPEVPELALDTGDWTVETLPSWIDSILEGLRRPGQVLSLGPGAVLQGLRETPTLLLMHWAFANGMMHFGVFRAVKAPAGRSGTGFDLAGCSPSPGPH